MPLLTEFDQWMDLGKHNEANRQLLAWLSDDQLRGKLYREMISDQRVLEFPSFADAHAAQAGAPGYTPVYHQPAYLLACREHVSQAFTDTVAFSNAPFRELGSGTFMLALDKGPDHDEQRQFALTYMKLVQPQSLALSSVAFQAAAALPLKSRRFDLADLAEQVALRYIGFLFGFAQSDHLLLQSTMRKAYRGLSYQMMARHFVFEAGTVLEAGHGMAALLNRVTELIGMFRKPIGQAQIDEIEAMDRELVELRGIEVDARPGEFPLKDFVPVLRRLAKQPVAGVKPDYSTTELGIIAVGLIAGAIGNIQASICIALQEFFRFDSPARFEQLQQLARDAWLENPEMAAPSALDAWVMEALRLNPPAAFLPRQAVKDITLKGPNGTSHVIPAGSLILLGVGGATRDFEATRGEMPAQDQTHADDQFHVPPAQGADATMGCPHSRSGGLIFGGRLTDEAYFHSCVGQNIAMSVVMHTVRQVLILPGLAQSLNPRTGQPFGLSKLWGYNCLSYPMEFKRSAILRHSSLNVMMKVKSPTAEHAEALKQIIMAGAPRIEKALRDSRHIHFAWFMFLENDSMLALHTIYDRDFDSYIEHFALEVGPLFDRLFQHIEDAPPLPVKDFPREFVDTIRRFDRPPAANYLFSAYPEAEAAAIIQSFSRKALYRFGPG